MIASRAAALASSFASPTPGLVEPLLGQLGFSGVARHRSKDVSLFRQGGINFIVNREPRSAAAYFAAEHGPSACALAFRVKDSHKAYARALALGAQPVGSGAFAGEPVTARLVAEPPVHLDPRLVDEDDEGEIDRSLAPLFDHPSPDRLSGCRRRHE